MIKTVSELSQVRLQAQQDLECYRCRVLVCSGTGCIATGSNYIHALFEKLVKEKILSAGRRKEICKGCQWEHICEKGDETV